MQKSVSYCQISADYLYLYFSEKLASTPVHNVLLARLEMTIFKMDSTVLSCVARKKNPMNASRILIGEIILFIWQKKLWWLIPLLIMLLLASALIFMTQSSAISPFVYALI
jgi:hypothetical protein